MRYKAPYELTKDKGDQGWDIRADKDTVLNPSQTKLIDTGLYFEFEEGIYADVRARSGISSKGILCHTGLVDSDYRGEIKVCMTNLSRTPYIITNGMYLWGLPRINDIQSVNITYPSVTDDVKEISSSEDIELALKLTGFLKYDLFGEVNSEEEPAITITYFLKDGTSKTISANNTTVWWNNKIHVIKDKEMFVNLTEGIFFLEDLQTK